MAWLQPCPSESLAKRLLLVNLAKSISFTFVRAVTLLQVKALNHFVPRLYLKRFSPNGVHVLEYRTVVKHEQVPVWRPIAIRKLTSLRHLYTSVDYDDDGYVARDDSLETYFDEEFESPAEEAIDRAVRGEAMRPDHWKRLARFFGLQHLRTPAHYIHTRNWWSSEMEGIVTKLTGELKRLCPAGPSTDVLRRLEKDFTASFGIPLKIIEEGQAAENRVRLRFNTVIGRRAWLQDLKRQLAHDGVIKGLESHRWSTLRVPDREVLITSDRPAINIHRNRSGDWDFGAGWQEQGAVLYMPLDPSTLLFTEVGTKRIPRDTLLTKYKVREVNQTIAIGAMRSILSTRVLPDVEVLRPRQVNYEKASREEAEFATWDDVQTIADLNL